MKCLAYELMLQKHRQTYKEHILEALIEKDSVKQRQAKENLEEIEYRIKKHELYHDQHQMICIYYKQSHNKVDLKDVYHDEYAQ